jgi:hypothetical protein
MSPLAVEAVVAQLSHAGLNLSLVPTGGLAVAPRSHLTPDLRELIRSSKAMLIDWLTAANDTVSRADHPSDALLEWKELAAAYHAHHFDCPICIAAGRGAKRGLRCGVGAALWTSYQSIE